MAMKGLLLQLLILNGIWKSWLKGMVKKMKRKNWKKI
jgi:hypothetical protein